MIDYSRQALLERLEQGSVLYDWPALVAIDRAQLNLMLRDQFLQGLADLAFMEPITGTFAIEEGGWVQVTLRNVVLGPPQLSFENAVLGSADATVRISLVAGEYQLEQHTPGQPPVVREAFTLGEDMGFTLDAEVTLSVGLSNSGQRATVSLDLANGRDFSCSLGNTRPERRLIGEQLKAHIVVQPAYRRVYNLGAFDLEDYGPLSPRDMVVMTQTAPWGAQPGSAREGDGCMVLFLQLAINRPGGTLPLPNDDFPYLLPDDEQSPGAGISSTLVIDSDIKDLAGDRQPESVLAPLLLPNGRAFKSLDVQAFDPHDTLVFGQIQATDETFEVQPPAARVVAGEQQAFRLAGTSNTTAWSASNISLPLAVGSISGGGNYEAKGEKQFAQDQQLVVVRGLIGEEAQGVRRAALVVESSQAIQIAPRIVTWARGLAPIELKVTSTTGNPLAWTLVASQQGAARPGAGANQAADSGAQVGELVDLGHGQARFTPYPPDNSYLPITLQTIRATDALTGAYGEASVIIIAYTQSLSVEPYHVPKLFSADPLQFARKPRGEPDEAMAYSWSVFGEGSIDSDGLFTPPPEPSQPASVVMLDRDEEAAGYAIVEFAKHAPTSVSAARWKDLQVFGIEVLGSTECYANGLQQIVLRITIETAALDNGEQPPISDVELASLRLSNVGTHAQVRFLEPDELGLVIPEDTSRGEWATTHAKNRFDPPGSFAPASKEVQQSSPGTRVKYLYVQTTYRGTQQFRAEFQNETTKRWFNSQDYDPSPGVKVVDLKGKPPMAYAIELFKFNFDRVRSDGGEDEGDDYTYVDDALDYWRLPYIDLNGRLLKFSMLRMAKDSNVSTIRWESEHLAETYFSYTGMAFYPNYDDTPPPAEMNFDVNLLLMAKTQAAELDERLDARKPVERGELVIGVYRVSDFKFWHDGMGGADERYRERLDLPVDFELVDQEGNPHKLRISFPTSGKGARNKPLLSLR